MRRGSKGVAILRKTCRAGGATTNLRFVKICFFRAQHRMPADQSASENYILWARFACVELCYNRTFLKKIDLYFNKITFAD